MFETCSLAAKGVLIGGVKRSSLHVSMFAHIFSGNMQFELSAQIGARNEPWPLIFSVNPFVKHHSKLIF